MARKMKFKTELKQMMDIIIHSLYSHREVFLRELISNASDAIDSLRYRALTDKDLNGLPDRFEIRIVPDREAGTITVSDNGAGMSREEVVANLGTLARSGSREFLRRLKEAESSDYPELIGQFGVGFYSAFMVADRVTVVSRAAGGESEPVRWESEGGESFSVDSAERAEPGTDVVLHLKEDAKEYLEEQRIKQIVRRFSDFIEHQIVLVLPDEKKEEPGREVLNRRKAIWLRPESEVGEEEYREFYKHISRDFEDPLETIHFVAEGLQEFRAILFIPARRPFDFFFSESRSSLQLYVKRVFITDNFEKLLPSYLRFVQGVVDSSDLPLNVSREMLQDDPLVARINKSLTAKVLNTLTAMKKERFEDYLGFHKEFGQALKEGITSDWENREKVADLLLYQSTATSPGEYTSLEQYVERMQENQKEIYYLLGDSREELERAPYLEGLKARGREVLFLTDPVDEWVAGSLGEYRDKPLKPVDRGELPEDETVDGKKVEEQEKEYRDFLEFLNGRIEEVSEVRLSSRLTESAAVLVSPETEMGAHMERLLKRLGRDEITGGQRILELNPGHPVVRALGGLYEKDPADSRLDDYGRLLYEEAVVAEGSRVKDPAAFARRINELLIRGLGE